MGQADPDDDLLIMTPYIGIYAFLAFLTFVKVPFSRKTVVFVVLALFLNLAYTNGIDWTAYQDIYTNSPYQTRGIEYGYTAITLLGRALGLNFEIFKFLLLSLDLYVILRFVFGKSPKPMFAILILFQTFLLGNFFEPAIRQIQSIVIFLLAVGELRKRNTVNYYLLIATASLFHQSALVLLLLPWFIHHVSFKSSLVALFFLGALGLEMNSLVQYLIQFGIFGDYSFYLGGAYLEGITPTVFNLTKVLVYVAPLYILRNFRRNDPTVELLRQLSFVFVVFYVLQFFALLYYRFNFFFIIPYVIYISYMFQAMRIPSNNVIVVSAFVLIHFVSLIKGISYYRERDHMKFFPYTNYVIALVMDNTYSSVQEKIDVRLDNRWADLLPFLAESSK